MASIKIHLSILCFLCLPTLLLSQNTWQYWNETEVKYQFLPSFFLGFTIEQRIVDNISTFSLHNYGLALHYKINEYFKMKVNYLYEREKEINWNTENRIEIVPKISFFINNISFGIYPRIEYRIFNETNYWRWRQKFDIKKPFIISDFQFIPYISNEIFYRFNTNTLKQNWFTVGVNKTIKKNIQIGFFYRVKSKKSENKWYNNNVTGTSFSYLIKHSSKVQNK